MGPIRLINQCSVINIEETGPSGKESSNKFVQSGEKWDVNGSLCVFFLLGLGTDYAQCAVMAKLYTPFGFPVIKTKLFWKQKKRSTIQREIGKLVEFKQSCSYERVIKAEILCTGYKMCSNRILKERRRRLN